MAFINGLFAFVFLGCLIAFLIGLVKPSVFKIKGQPLNRKQATLYSVLGAVASLVVFSATMSDEQKLEQQAQQQQIAAVPPVAAAEVQEVQKVANVSEQTESTTPESATEETTQVQSLTAQQRNAVRSAENYLSFTGFSRDGLIAQLSSDAGDGYSVADATVAVDSLDVDWNEQAVKSAKNYLSFSGFSCSGLIEQLSSRAGDKYTVSQAKYGAQQAGACS